MNITVPQFVQSSHDRYTVRPRFFPRPVQQHDKLERALHLLARGESLHDRATEVLAAHLRAREKEDEEEFIPPERFAVDSGPETGDDDQELLPHNPAGMLAERAPRRPPFPGCTDRPVRKSLWHNPF